MRKTGFSAVLLALLLTISGCEHFSANRSAESKAEPPTATKIPQRSEVPADLQQQMRFIQKLNESDTAQRNNLYASSKRALEEKASITHQLQLAWVLATPGHAYSNPWQAGKQLQEVLAKKGMTKDLRLFVGLRLRDIERQQQMLNRLSEAEAKIKALTNLEHSMEERDAEVQEP